jgi:hypothetical protein
VNKRLFDGTTIIEESEAYVDVSQVGLQVTYGVQLKNADTSAIITPGLPVPIGTKVSIIPSGGSLNNTQMSWYTTGGAFDTPYGYWADNDMTAPSGEICSGSSDGSSPDLIAGVEVAPYICAEQENCHSGSSHITGQIIYGYWNIYSPVLIMRPTLSAVWSGAGVTNCSADGLTCTVSNPGTVTVNATYGPTSATMHGLERSRPKGGSFSATCSLFNPNFAHFSVPASEPIPISFNVSAIVGNDPPTPPIITGPTTGSMNTSYSFGFTSTDPDDDNITYEIDWDNNGTVDATLPPSGSYPSGTTGVSTYQWPANGSHTFEARAKDTYSNVSAWSNYTIVMSNGGGGTIGGSCATDKSSVLINNPIIFTASPAGGSGPYTYSWISNPTAGSSCQVSGTNQKQYLCAYSSAGTYSTSVLVTDSQSNTGNITCGNVTVIDPSQADVTLHVHKASSESFANGQIKIVIPGGRPAYVSWSSALDNADYICKGEVTKGNPISLWSGTTQIISHPAPMTVGTLPKGTYDLDLYCRPVSEVGSPVISNLATIQVASSSLEER